MDATRKLVWGLGGATVALGGSILLIMKAAAAFHAFAATGGGL